MNKQIIEEASDWFVEFSTGDADRATKSAFDRWLRKSPEHVRVYLELLPIWDDAAIAIPGDKTSAEELIQLARGTDNLVALDRTERMAVKGTSSPSGKVTATRMSKYVAIAASVAAICALGSVIWFEKFRLPVYASGLGKQLSVTLSDGSTVDLNTRSRIRVKFTADARDVELLEGQALFRVAKDKLRPFTVSSDSTRVRAVGTQFDVYRKRSGTTVTVVEGKVAVGDADTPALAMREPAIATSGALSGTDGEHAILVSAGEQVTLPSAAAAKPRRADVEMATAWTHGRLIFDSTPLTEVAEEFNRYNSRPIIVEETPLKSFYVNGSFRSSDPTSLLKFLKEQPGLSVQESAFQIRISYASGGAVSP